MAGSEQTKQDEMPSHSVHSVEKVIVFVASFLVISLVGYLVIRNEPFADPNLVVLVRIILAMATAVLGATIPGFFEVGWSLKGLTIRATGAAAFFVLTIVFTPDVLVRRSYIAEPTRSQKEGDSETLHLSKEQLRSQIDKWLHSGEVTKAANALSSFDDAEAKLEECERVFNYSLMHNRFSIAESVARQCWEESKLSEALRQVDHEKMKTEP